MSHALRTLELTRVDKFWVHRCMGIVLRDGCKKSFFLIRKFWLGAKYAYLVQTMTPFFLTS